MRHRYDGWDDKGWTHLGFAAEDEKGVGVIPCSLAGQKSDDRTQAARNACKSIKPLFSSFGDLCIKDISPVDRHSMNIFVWKDKQLNQKETVLQLPLHGLKFGTRPKVD